MTYAGPVVVLIFQQLHNWQSRRQAQATDAKVDESKAVTGDKLDSIHAAVNGNLSASQENVKDLNRQIAVMTAEIARLQAVANVASLSQKITELTAQIAAAKDPKPIA